MAQRGKNLHAVQEIRVQSLGWEDPLEKEMVTLQRSCLENPMDTGAWGGLQSMGPQRVRHDRACLTSSTQMS